MKTTDKYVFFHDGIFSQWYMRNMKINNVTYNCCEQFMMHMKALHFEDQVTADYIMKAQTPSEQKTLGRLVKMFDKAEWDKVCMSYVFQGNHAKFKQNLDLRASLFDTGSRILVEAAPNDPIWGIGVGENESGIENPQNWRGTNLLGWVLTLVKQELQNE